MGAPDIQGSHQLEFLALPDLMPFSLCLHKIPSCDMKLGPGSQIKGVAQASLTMFHSDACHSYHRPTCEPSPHTLSRTLLCSVSFYSTLCSFIMFYCQT